MFADPLQRRSRHFIALAVEPHFPPDLASHAHHARHRHGFPTGVQRTEIHSHHIPRTRRAGRGTNGHLVRLSRRPDPSPTQHLAARRIHHPGLNRQFHIPPGGIRIHPQGQLARRIGVQRFALQFLIGPGFWTGHRHPFPEPHRPVGFGQRVPMQPGHLGIPGRAPLERSATDPHLHLGIGHRAAEVVGGANLNRNALPGTESANRISGGLH